MAAKLSDEQIYAIARVLGDPRRLDLLRRIGKARDTLPCEALRCGCGITPAAVFLASVDSKYMTGQTLNISGGIR